MPHVLCKARRLVRPGFVPRHVDRGGEPSAWFIVDTADIKELIDDLTPAYIGAFP